MSSAQQNHVVVTICPPAVAAGAVFSQPTVQRRQPVHSPEYDDAGACEDGLSFEDLSSCQIRQHVAERRVRRLQTPVWSQSTAAVRAVLLEFLERRAGLSCWKQCGPQCSHKKARGEDARQRYINTLAALKRHKAPLAKRPDVFLQIVRDYYGAHLDSVEVAARNEVTAAFVRQFLVRMNRVAESLGYSATSDESVMGGKFSVRRTIDIQRRIEKLCAEQFHFEYKQCLRTALSAALSSPAAREYKLALRRELRRKKKRSRKTV